ncbi:hypothetical protein FLGE108171_09565 [Flavobacterium gelidilacus]
MLNKKKKPHKQEKSYLFLICSLNLDKTPSFTVRVSGIKGQYLLFEDGTVFNVRSNEGYVVRISL